MTSYALLCPCCGQRENFNLVYRKLGYPIVRCSSCGVGRTVVEDFSPSDYYTAEYFEGGHADGYADYSGSEALLRLEFRKIVELIRAEVPEGKLLEVGCAFGFLLAEAKAHFDVVGVEVSQAAVEHCHRSGIQNVHCGEVTKALADEIGEVDVVVLLDVIEHLVEPDAVLKILTEQLRPGGLILISTGDWASPLARLMGKRWRLMTPPQHLSFFTPRSARRMCSRLGLEDISIEHPWKFVPAPLIAYQAARMLGLNQGAALASRVPRMGVPVNLYDAMRVVGRKRRGH